jgi:hypothetical protein
VTGCSTTGRYAKCRTPKRCWVSCVSAPQHSRNSHWRATCRETGPRGSDRGPLEKDQPHGRHLASGPSVCKLRGKNLLIKPGRSRRYQVPPGAARIITALLALRDQVIAPILAGVRSPRPGRKPARWTRIDADYENLRVGMQALLDDLGISTLPAVG